ncbi:hypothetical protein COCSUDRAFT_60389 [Coccomyxa subellipsoidea C-169]|uniref:Uncharacterized protein n=1 Tax=Coccomyxa subellipsoidea (strain C-169) TaxID=574566 RepID=I0YJ63_COCSC|nr:hypothetical protein COCSUDRAFT_60389 [Coccomyxa subellipsoidea C-169]EIE18432.1 hypothetical protein COCSUDRAFT_60389 [Coccomyxa subellipsoidea C-169]|eukprot:XP_005642976.1 hypothetical protein COCSUDRAFT_60389 [Coccomyxa subellipsoidea C-169]
MGGSVKALQRAGEEVHRLRGARLSRPTGRTRYMRAGGACLWGRGHKNWWARPVPQKGKETPGAMPGRALWDSRPVVPRDWGPLSAVATITFAAQHSVAYCNHSLHAAPASPESAQPPSNTSAPLLPVAFTLPKLYPSPGRGSTAVVVASIAAAAALALAIAFIALVLLVRSRRLRSPCSQAAEGGLQGERSGRKLKKLRTFVSLESHLFRQSRLRRLGPLGSEEVEIGPVIGRGSFGRL